jgi:hypothetical protein
MKQLRRISYALFALLPVGVFANILTVSASGDGLYEIEITRVDAFAFWRRANSNQEADSYSNNYPYSSVGPLPAAAPEPSTLGLLGGALTGLAMLARRASSDSPNFA